MLYYKSSRILTWYDQYLPPARGSQEEWESGEGGGRECYGLDDLIGPLKPMYQTSNRPEKKLTLYCVIWRRHGPMAPPTCQFTPLPTRCRPWLQWSTQQVGLCHQSWPVSLVTSHLRSTFQCELVTIVFVSLANCSRSWTSK